MYDINTKRDGHLKVRRAAVAHANAVANPELEMAKLWTKYIKQEIDRENNFIGKLVKKVTGAIKGKAMDKATKEIAKTVGTTKANEMRAQLESHVASSPTMQKKMNEINKIGTLAVATAIAGGAAAAAPAIGSALGVGGKVGAGATVGGAEAIGTGTAALGAGSQLIKQKSTTDLVSQVKMPDKSSMEKILGPIAKEGIKATGGVPSGSNNESYIKQFLNDVVGPQTGQQVKDLAKDAAENALVDFLSTIKNKKLNGETLPKALDKIAGLQIQAENKAESKVKQIAAGNIGEFDMQNWWIILIALALLYLAARSKKGG